MTRISLLELLFCLKCLNPGGSLLASCLGARVLIPGDFYVSLVVDGATLVKVSGRVLSIFPCRLQFRHCPMPVCHRVTVLAVQHNVSSVLA
jgi:hypothetical protein